MDISNEHDTKHDDIINRAYPTHMINIQRCSIITIDNDDELNLYGSFSHMLVESNRSLTIRTSPPQLNKYFNPNSDFTISPAPTVLKPNEYVNISLTIGVDLYLRASMGSGKTTSVITALKDYPNATILVISPRRSLTYTFKSKFDSLDVPIESYLTDGLKVRKSFNVDRLIISPNSLYRLGTNLITYDFVMLDEVVLLLDYLYGSHIEQRDRIYPVFEYIIRTARTLILSDAFLPEVIVDEFKHIRDGHPYDYIDVIKPSGIKYIHSTEEEVLDLIRSKKRVYCFCETKHAVTRIKHKIDSMGIDVSILTLTSETDDLGPIEDPGQMLDYDVVIASPIVLSGVDFNWYHFDYIAGFYSGRVLSKFALFQMSRRIRKVASGKCLLVGSELSDIGSACLAHNYSIQHGMNEVAKYEVVDDGSYHKLHLSDNTFNRLLRAVVDFRIKAKSIRFEDIEMV